MLFNLGEELDVNIAQPKILALHKIFVLPKVVIDFVTIIVNYGQSFEKLSFAIMRYHHVLLASTSEKYY